MSRSEDDSRRRGRSSLILSLVCIAVGLLLLTGNLHLIRMKDGWTWGWKAGMSLRNTLVDIREWESVDFYQHPDISGILMQRGHRDQIRRPPRPEGPPGPAPDVEVRPGIDPSRPDE